MSGITVKSATGKLLTGSNFESLTIHSTPFLTNNVLAPNVKTFNSQFPELAIVMDSKIHKVDLMSLPRTSIHLALRLGKEDDDSLIYEAITPIHISPVCSKGYLQQNSLTKINLTVDPQSWQKWSKEWQQTINFDNNLHGDGMQSEIEMAEQGVGMAMGYFPFLAQKVAAKQLVMPYPESVSVLDNLYLVYPKQLEQEPVVKDFTDWVKQIIGTSDKKILTQG